MTTVTQIPSDPEILREPAEAVAAPVCNCPDDCERDHEND